MRTLNTGDTTNCVLHFSSSSPLIDQLNFAFEILDRNKNILVDQVHIVSHLEAAAATLALSTTKSRQYYDFDI